MRILIVSATKLEIDPLARQYGVTFTKENFYTTRRGMDFIDILITGVGAVQMTYHLTNALLKTQYNLVLNIGIAGTFSGRIQLGEIVHVVNDEFVDFGVFSKGVFQTATEAALIDATEKPFETNKIANRTPWHKELPQIKQVKGATVNRVTDVFTEIDGFVKKFNPDIETMEGAAFFYVMNHQSIPYFQIRGISNIVGARDKSQWKIPQATDNLCRFTTRFIDNVKRGLMLS